MIKLTRDQAYNLLATLVCVGSVDRVLDRVRIANPEFEYESLRFLGLYAKEHDPKKFKLAHGYVDVAAFKRAWAAYLRKHAADAQAEADAQAAERKIAKHSKRVAAGFRQRKPVATFRGVARCIYADQHLVIVVDPRTNQPQRHTNALSAVLNFAFTELGERVQREGPTDELQSVMDALEFLLGWG